MTDRLRRLARFGLPVLAIGMFALALLVLRGELSRHHYHEIGEHLHSLSARTLLLAAGLTLLGYGALTGYDALAMRYVRRKVRATQVALASFIAYSLSQTLGFALLTGGAIRYRFWSSWGLSAGEIARAVGFAGVSLYLGALTLLGAALLGDSATLGTLTRLQPGLLRLLGFLLLLPSLAYLGAVFLRGRPLAIRGWRFEIPGRRLALLQFVVAGLDWSLAAAVLFVVLPPGRGVGFFGFLGVFVLAQLAGLLSHVPGGLGVFDTLMVLALAPFDRAPEVLGALVAFRAIYYLGPFLIGSSLLLGSEGLRHRRWFARMAARVGRLLPGLVPYAVAGLIFCGGLVLLFSGVTPGVPSRLRWIGEVLPLPLIEASHFLGSLIGMGLLILAWGLGRRLDAAYYLTLLLLPLGMLASILKGGDYEEALILAAILVVVIPVRHRFYRRTKLLAEPLSLEWIVMVVLVLVAVVAVGEFRYRQVAYRDELFWQFALHADAPRFLRSTVGALALLAGFGLLRLFQPSRPAAVVPSGPELDRAEAIIQRQDRAAANLALMGDKRLLFSDSGNGFLAYAVSGRCWIAMGDPVAPPAEQPELVWTFRALADRHAAWTVFYEVSQQQLPTYIDLGLTLAKLGEQARITLSEFDLEGSNRRGLRRAFRLAERAGASFEIVSRAELPPLLPELQAVSDEWLAAKRAREKGFSMGRFDPAYLQRFRHAVIRREGRIVAFANLWETASRQELSMDLMRYATNAPETVMDYLFVRLLLWAKAEGYQRFNLGMAPFSGFQRRSLAPLWQRLGGLLFQHGERFYHFRGLRRFKEKFDPSWEPVYLASPGGLTLPRVLASLATLINDGWRGVLRR